MSVGLSKIWMAAQFVSTRRPALTKLQVAPHLQGPLVTFTRKHRQSCSSFRPSALVSDRITKNSAVKPRIVLVGWLGAKERHFDKYVQLWRDLGHETVAIRPPTTAILLPPRGDVHAYHFAKRLQQAAVDAPSQPVVYHVFSNAGFIFLSTVLRLAALRPHLTGINHQEAAKSADLKHPLKGNAVSNFVPARSIAHLGRMDAVIFDSAPAPLTSDMASRGFMAAFLGQQAHGIECRHPHLVAAASLPLGWLLAFGPIAIRNTQLWAAWGISLTSSKCSQLEFAEEHPELVPLDGGAHIRGEDASCHSPTNSLHQSGARAEDMSGVQLLRLAAAAPQCPQLALYSTADVLIPPSAVEAFMRAQGERGVQTTLHRWHDTAHCEHYRYHNEEYKEQLVCFVKSLKLGDGA